MHTTVTHAFHVFWRSYGIEKKDFDAFALSIVKAVEYSLPAGEVTPVIREAWYSAATASGDFALMTYPAIKQGAKFTVWKKVRRNLSW
jgi:hypothetical protein